MAAQVSKALCLNKITSVIVEGGQKTLQAFINEGLWDEARIFSSETYLKEGIKKPQLKSIPVKETLIDSDSLKIILND